MVLNIVHVQNTICIIAYLVFSSVVAFVPCLTFTLVYNFVFNVIIVCEEIIVLNTIRVQNLKYCNEILKNIFSSKRVRLYDKNKYIYYNQKDMENS